MKVSIDRIEDGRTELNESAYDRKLTGSIQISNLTNSKHRQVERSNASHTGYARQVREQRARM